jgi:tRNA (guanine37-N1)-methyltransferase
MVSVREALGKLIPSEKAQLMYHAYDIIGDVAIVKVPNKLDDYERLVGEAFHQARPDLKAVFRVIGKTEEIERTRKLRLIWSKLSPSNMGEAELENLARTVYREYGCRFIVDVRKVFFTPRLSHERMTIARQVRPGEVIVNMFGGIGTYAIIIAKTCPGVDKIYTVDISPISHELAKENVNINKCWEKVIPILGDARTVCRDQLKGTCSRAIMPLPEQATSYLDSAIEALKEGIECVVNFYCEISGKHVEIEVHRVVDETKSRIGDCGAKRSDAVRWRIVREVGTRRYHIAVDFTVLK